VERLVSVGERGDASLAPAGGGTAMTNRIDDVFRRMMRIGSGRLLGAYDEMQNRFVSSSCRMEPPWISNSIRAGMELTNVDDIITTRFSLGTCRYDRYCARPHGSGHQ